MNATPRKTRCPRGMVLVVVLVVVAFLALAGFAYCELMLAEHNSVEILGRQAQAHLLAESGIEYIKKFLAQDPATRQSLGGVYDNAEHFQSVLVIDDDDPQECGRFSVVSPNMENGREGAVRFGLEDESGRLNLNTLLFVDKQKAGAGRDLLMKLPNMTEDIADAILDWIDPDDEPREFGAEADYYSSLNPPYKPKNGPFDTVEELLLVKGVTPQLLFGSDANRNGMLDPGEQAADQSGDQTDQSSTRGWSAYLTLHSYETNVKDDGTQRIDLNATDLDKLHQDLSAALDEDQATYIVAYRLNGPYTPPRGGGGPQPPNPQPISVNELDLTQPGRTRISTILDLIGGFVQYTPKGETTGPNGPRRPNPKIAKSPFADSAGEMNTYLPKLMDAVTTNKSKKIPGRVNINQAPKTVMMGIPYITEDIVDQIIAKRQVNPTSADSDQRYETWPLAYGIVTLEQMKRLMPFVTGAGSVFRAQIVGYFEEKGPAARIECIIDATTSTPRLVFWRDISHLGRGYPVETLGISAP